MEIRKFHDELIKLFSIELEEFPGIRFYKDPSEYKGLEFAQSVDGNDFFWLKETLETIKEIQSRLN